MCTDILLSDVPGTRVKTDAIDSDIPKRQLSGGNRSQSRIVFLCDSCNRPILNPEDGLIVHGNIYAASVGGNRGGLIGNNFPDETTFSAEEVGMTTFCRPCFQAATNID